MGDLLASPLFYINADLPTQITGANLVYVYTSFVSIHFLAAALHSANLRDLNYSNSGPSFQFST